MMLLPTPLVSICKLHLQVYLHQGWQPSGAILGSQMTTAHSSILLYVTVASTLNVNSFREVRLIHGIQEIRRPSFHNNLTRGTISIRTLHIPAQINDKESVCCKVVHLVLSHMVAKSKPPCPAPASSIMQLVTANHHHSGLVNVIGRSVRHPP